MQLQVTIANLSRYQRGIVCDTELIFPTTTEKVQQALREIWVDGFICSEIILLASQSDTPRIPIRTGQYDSLDELNYLVSRINELAPEELEMFVAAAQHGEYTFSLQDFINLTYNLDCYELYPDISDYEDYGHMLVEAGVGFELPEAAKLYFDYEAYGEATAINEGGVFTKQGYIFNNRSAFKRVYDGEHIPPEYKVFHYPPRQVSHGKSNPTHEK